MGKITANDKVTESDITNAKQALRNFCQNISVEKIKLKNIPLQSAGGASSAGASAKKAKTSQTVIDDLKSKIRKILGDVKPMQPVGTEAAGKLLCQKFYQRGGEKDEKKAMQEEILASLRDELAHYMTYKLFLLGNQSYKDIFSMVFKSKTLNAEENRLGFYCSEKTTINSLISELNRVENIFNDLALQEVLDSFVVSYPVGARPAGAGAIPSALAGIAALILMSTLNETHELIFATSTGNQVASVIMSNSGGDSKQSIPSAVCSSKLIQLAVFNRIVAIANIVEDSPGALGVFLSKLQFESLKNLAGKLRHGLEINDEDIYKKCSEEFGSIEQILLSCCNKILEFEKLMLSARASPPDAKTSAATALTAAGASAGSLVSGDAKQATAATGDAKENPQPLQLTANRTNTNNIVMLTTGGNDSKQESYKEIDVPNDGSCGLYSVVLSVLLPVFHNPTEFNKMYIKLFGADEKSDAAEQNLRSLLKNYDGTAEYISAGSLLKTLIDGEMVEMPEGDSIPIRGRLRIKLGEHILKYKADSFVTLSHDAKQLGTIDSYINRNLYKKEGFAGALELAALANMLNIRIEVFQQIEAQPLRYQSVYGENNANAIYLVYIHKNYIEHKQQAVRHYHYLIKPEVLASLQQASAASTEPAAAHSTGTVTINIKKLAPQHSAEVAALVAGAAGKGSPAFSPPPVINKGVNQTAAVTADPNAAATPPAPSINTHK